ncbi:hypothetical protein [Paraglaciecola arctica]|uniref:hypothetical protein n=1 Tax=Paraglaciecola arctica TaxID=1128911 RepID=UPI001C0705E5|nr:hypothetical protein [Paraglaciecola arctica]MBU3002741.1 hypothetical protein [Paraglaciecola arctica]
MEQQFKIKGGSVEKSLNGETHLDLKAIAKEAWNLSSNTKTAVLHGVLLLFFIAILFAWIMQSILGVTDLNLVSQHMMITLKVAGVIVTTPIIATMFLLGISHSVGIKPRFLSILKNVLGSVLVILLALLLAAMSDIGSIIGSQISVLFGLALLFYINLATGFSIMLLVEKRLPPSQCVILSMRVFHKYWMPLSLFYLAYYCCLFLGALSLGFAYIWIIPFFVNMKGVLYRELFGVKVLSISNEANPSETIFHA